MGVLLFFFIGLMTILVGGVVVYFTVRHHWFPSKTSSVGASATPVSETEK